MAEAIYAGDGGLFKTCSACGEAKSLPAFSKNKHGALGRRSACRSCNAEYDAKRYLADADMRRASARAKRDADPERFRAYEREWYSRNSEIKRQKAKEFRVRNPEYFRSWQIGNADHLRKKGREYDAKRLSTTKGRIENIVSAGVHRGLMRGSKNGRRAFELLGYTVDELMRHLEKQFKPGMSWDNYGEWYVDHKVPLSAFNYESPHHIDFRRAWALSNLQPL